FNKVYSNNNIITIYMPPHSSYLLQLLDISYFRLLKQVYRSFIKLKIQLRFSYINKLDFLEAYLKAYQEIFNSFSTARIYLFNLEKVLSKLNILLATPIPLSSRGGPLIVSLILITPYIVYQLKQHAFLIKKYLERGP
ncbi:hypothetical protein ASPSYDRAFT_165527, partial [Aspergillus sydowii CBS 593.65]